MMRIACSMSAWKNSVDDALGAIESMGFTCVDIIAIPGWGLVEPSELTTGSAASADNLAEMLAAHNLTAVGVNAAVPNLYQRDDQSVNAQRLAQVEGLCRLMKQLRIPVASFFPGGNWPAQEMTWDIVLQGEVATLQEMLAIGKQHDVTLTVEPHANTPFEKLDQIRALLDALPELQVAYDPSHFALQGLDLCDTTFILDRAAHVHVRDAGPGKMQLPVGEGTVDFAWLMAELKSRNYEGAVSVEYLPGNEGQIPELKSILERLV
jgi:sugar phosphate isomerase/epimerase